MTQQTPKTAQARGLTYPFETLPEDGRLMEVADGVFWMRIAIPFALDHINLWLLRDGDSWVAVDTGVDFDKARKSWEGVIAHALDGLPISRVIVTHLHPDHVGLAGWLVNRYDAEFMMSRSDYLMCRAMAADTGREAPMEAIRFYRAAGFKEEGLERYRKRFGGFGEMIHPLPQSYTRLQQDDTLDIGGRTWRVEVGSGHAPEHICLYCPELKVLISGDQVLPRISSNVSLFPTEPSGDPLGDWIRSCARLRDALPDDTLVLPAHNEPFYGLHARLTALIDGHERGLARLVEVCAEPRRAVDQEVFSVLFKRRIDSEVFFMATGEALAHLACLVHRGQVTRRVNADGVCYYQTQTQDTAAE